MIQRGDVQISNMSRAITIWRSSRNIYESWFGLYLINLTNWPEMFNKMVKNNAKYFYESHNLSDYHSHSIAD